MKKVKMLSLVLAIVMVLGLAGCGSSNSGKPAPTAAPTAAPTTSQPAPTTGSNPASSSALPADGPTVTWQFASASDPSASNTKAMVKAKELLEAGSNGKIKIDVYPSSQLGGDAELVSSAQAGNVPMVQAATSPQVSAIPALAVFDMPAVLNDMDITNKAINDPAFKDKIQAEYNKKGLQLLMIAPMGFREMSSNKSVKQFSDFKGIKIRTMENKYHMAFWSALGANPTPLAFSEVYIGLQQGLIDAQENPYATLIASKLYEQQKYVINTDHIMFVCTFYMNKAKYDALPDSYKKFINDTMVKVNQYTIDIAKSDADAALKTIKDKGVQVIDLPADVHKQMKDAAKPVYDMIGKAIGQDFVDALLSAYDKASKK